MSGDDLWISIVCDGPARHAVRTIERFSRVDSAWYAHVHGGLGDAILGGPRLRGGVQRTARAWRLECPACGTNSRVTVMLLLAVLDRLEESGVERLDLGTLNTLARNGSRL